MRIVVADDAARLRTIFARIARQLGHEIVAEAPDAPALLHIVSSVVCDAVVLDGRLPPAGALALLPQLRLAAPSAAIYVIAALGETTLLRDALANGASGALMRPLLADRVAATLSGQSPRA